MNKNAEALGMPTEADGEHLTKKVCGATGQYIRGLYITAGNERVCAAQEVWGGAWSGDANGSGWAAFNHNGACRG
jgi:hypothetical protein